MANRTMANRKLTLACILAVAAGLLGCEDDDKIITTSGVVPL